MPIMAQINPIILSNATRFTASSFRTHSRSPSRSPIRKAQFTALEIDPLLSNLSPDSTLKALSETNAVATSGGQQDLLVKSIAQATQSERALGIKAAITGKKSREWYSEVSNWEWPNNKDAAKGKGFDQSPDWENEDHIGYLPVRLMEHYEERIEDIRDGLEALEVEDLKIHILDAHIPSRSRPGSSHGRRTPSPPSFVHLTDFTAVITATIVQALPYLARLERLLNIWDIRIMVLHQIPMLLKNLKTTQQAIQTAWSEIKSKEKAQKYNRETYNSTKAALETEVSSLGSQFDRILDVLEGRDDALPESWIDQMDNIESDFANWVVAAEQQVFLNELAAKRDTSILTNGSANAPVDAPVDLPDDQPVDKSVDTPDDQLLDMPVNAVSVNHDHLAEKISEPPGEASTEEPMSVSDDMSSELRPSTSQASDKHSETLQTTTPMEVTPLVFDGLSSNPDTIKSGDDADNLGEDDKSISEHSVEETVLPKSSEPVELASSPPPPPFRSPPPPPSEEYQTEKSLSNTSSTAEPTIIEPTEVSLTNEHNSHSLTPPVHISIDDSQIPELESNVPPAEPVNIQQDSSLTKEQDFILSLPPPSHTPPPPPSDKSPIRASKLDSPPASDSGVSEPAESPILSKETVDMDLRAMGSDDTLVTKLGEDTKAQSNFHTQDDSVGVDYIPKAESEFDMTGESMITEEHVNQEAKMSSTTFLQDGQLSNTTNKAAMSTILGESSPMLQRSPAQTISNPTSPVQPFTTEPPSPPQSPVMLPVFKLPKLRISTDEPKALQIPTQGHRRGQSEVSIADSVLSEAFSDISNAEIMNASTAEVSTPILVDAPRRFSSADLLSLAQFPTTATETRPRTMDFSTLLGKPLQVRTQSSPDLKLISKEPKIEHGTSIKGDSNEEKENLDDDFRPPLLQSASTSSIELIPKNRVRSILISRDSTLSLGSPLPTPTGSKGSLNHEEVSQEPEPTQQLRSHPSAETVSSFDSIPQDHHLRSHHSRETVGSDNSPVIEPTPSPSPSPLLPRVLPPPAETTDSLTPPLPRRSSKRVSRTLDSLTVTSPSRSNANLSPVMSPAAKSSPRSPESVTSFEKKSLKSPKTTDEAIEEKIQDILTTIPARIHLKSLQNSSDLLGASSNGNDFSNRLADNLSQSSQSNSYSSTNPSTRATTPTPSLILTPAHPARGPRASFSHGDRSDVKVYHLSRSGPNSSKNTPPIKLFVRLVGEDGERVMVRVGGGWADLAEYLREYALHHSSRSGMGNNQFDVQPLPSTRRASDGNMLGSSPLGSGHRSFSGPKTPGSRPASALDFNRPSPPSNQSRKQRRVSAASATLWSGAESPSTTFAISPSSPFAIEPSVEEDQPPPVPSIPSQYQSSQWASDLMASSPASAYNPSPTPKYTPLGAAGPVRLPKTRVSSISRSRVSSPIPPKSPTSSRPTTPTSRAPSRTGNTPIRSNRERSESPAPPDDWVQDIVIRARRSTYQLRSSSPAPPGAGPASTTAGTPRSTTPISGRKSSLGISEALSRSNSKDVSKVKSEETPKPRPKSRLSSFGFGSSDVDSPSGTGAGAGGGIRRVFLRHKSSFKR